MWTISALGDKMIRKWFFPSFAYLLFLISLVIVACQFVWFKKFYLKKKGRLKIHSPQFYNSKQKVSHLHLIKTWSRPSGYDDAAFPSQSAHLPQRWLCWPHCPGVGSRSHFQEMYFTILIKKSWKCNHFLVWQWFSNTHVRWKGSFNILWSFLVLSFQEELISIHLDHCCLLSFTWLLFARFLIYPFILFFKKKIVAIYVG